jgi:hypothetical protein
MSDALNAYMAAASILGRAEKDAERTVSEIKSDVDPLLTNWRQYYLTGLTDAAPPSLAIGGVRQPVNVGHLTSQWPKLQAAMTTYAEAEKAARDAYNQIPQDEKKHLAQPPWSRR